MKYLFFTLIVAALTITSCDELALEKSSKTSLEVNSIPDGRNSYNLHEVFEGGTSLGYDIDMEGNFAVAGEPAYSDIFLEQRGALHVYTRSGPESGWTEAAVLKHARGRANDNLGIHVAISDDYVVSATNDSIYAFKKVLGNFWKQQKAFVPANLPVEGLSVSSVDLFGDYLVVGHASLKIDGVWSVGAVYIFKQSNGKWIQEARIKSPDNSEHDWFGSDVAIDGNYLLVGARGGSLIDSGNPGPGTHGGKVYVYGRTGTGLWVRMPNANLVPNDIAFGDKYGEKIDFRGDYAIISANQQRVGGVKKGAAYIYKRSGSDWTFQQKLTAPNGERFGSAVGINSKYAIVGGGSYEGAVYIFKTNHNLWSLLRKETDPVSQRHHFGSQLAVDDVNTYMNSGFCCPAEVYFTSVE
jgi:hypothetical protein